MATSTQRPVVLVQKLITSYFTASVPTESGSCCLRSISESTDSGYVSETPVSKRGKIEFYLGKCNTKAGSSKRSLFSTSDLATYPTTTFVVAPSLSSVRLSCGSSSGSCEFVLFRK